MPKGTFRFYEELNVFLPKHRRKTDFEAPFIGKISIFKMPCLQHPIKERIKGKNLK
ncbi:MAG: hypothetical protein PVH36_03020 [Desulfobacterales bacterium]|jgi:hypothetical protein